jgi:NADPH2:quinone reductase
VLTLGRLFRGGLYPLKEFPAGIGKETAGTVVALPTDEAVLNHPVFQKQGFKVGGKVAAVSSPTIVCPQNAF